MQRGRLQRGDALLIVDVQPDFCPGGALPVAEGDRVIPILNEWIAAALDRNIPIYASRDWHPREHVSFTERGGNWPPHCVQDTRGADYHPELRLPPSTVKISKGVRLDRDQYSAFDETGLAAHLARSEVYRIWVGGLAQDVCVRATVIDARQHGFDTHLILDATRPVNPEAGRRAVEEMAAAGAIIEKE